MPQVLQAREGYELWRPNREKPESKTTKAIIAFVLIASAVLLVIITLGGWEKLQSTSVGVMTIVWAGIYVLFAILALNWKRGVLPVASAMAILMVIFAAVAAGGWFARDKDGLNSPALPEELLGLLTIIVIPVQILLIAVAMVGFNQAWNVEEERPIGGRPPDDHSGVRDTTEDTVTGTDDPAVRRDADEEDTEAIRRTRVRRDDDGDWADGTQTNPAI